MTQKSITRAVELEIQMLIENGRYIKDIAEDLGLSKSVIERYLKKLGPEKVAELRGSTRPTPEQARIAVLEEENRRLRAWVKRYARRIAELEAASQVSDGGSYTATQRSGEAS